MRHGRTVTAAVLVMLIGGSACDALRGDVYEITYEYQPGANYVSVWNGFFARGARECQNDSGINTVKFKIEGVPDPRPAGWGSAALSGRETCEWLLDNYG